MHNLGMTHIPKWKALFPADAVPPPTEDENTLFFPGPQYDFGMYKQSMARLASLEVETFASEHYGAVTGPQAGKLLQEGLRQTERFRSLIIEIYEQAGDFDETVEKAAPIILSRNEFDFMGMGKEMQQMVLKTAISRILENAGLINRPAP